RPNAHTSETTEQYVLILRVFGSDPCAASYTFPNSYTRTVLHDICEIGLKSRLDLFVTHIVTLPILPRLLLVVRRLWFLAGSRGKGQRRWRLEHHRTCSS